MADLGQPSLYTPEIGEKICEAIASGQTLVAVARELNLSLNTIFTRWLRDIPDFAQAYARAKEHRLLVMAEEIIQIADEAQNDTYVDEHGNRKTDWEVVGRSRLRVDTRKWLLSKLAARTFGDSVKLTGDKEQPLEVTIRSVLDDPKP